MGQETKIEWTDRTWNPVRGCSRVSSGCTNCYAERVAARFIGPGAAFEGFARRGPNGPRWTSRVELQPDKLGEPLSWRAPARVFVNSMSDLFHEALPDEAIAAVFGVMAACPQHTFQVLTKRPERAREWFRWVARKAEKTNEADQDFPGEGFWSVPDICVTEASGRGPLSERGEFDIDTLAATRLERRQWPLPNVWLGVSVEDQATADERIPVLLDLPAAVRFVSAEPLLGPVDFERVQWPRKHRVDVLRGGAWDFGMPGFTQHSDMTTLDWVIVGGESGPGARPCAQEWIGDIVKACVAARVPAFVKQLGACSVSTERVDEEGRWAWAQGLHDRKGGDPSEWPEPWPREFPQTTRGVSEAGRHTSSTTAAGLGGRQLPTKRLTASGEVEPSDEQAKQEERRLAGPGAGQEKPAAARG